MKQSTVEQALVALRGAVQEEQAHAILSHLHRGMNGHAPAAKAKRNGFYKRTPASIAKQAAAMRKYWRKKKAAGK